LQSERAIRSCEWSAGKRAGIHEPKLETAEPRLLSQEELLGPREKEPGTAVSVVVPAYNEQEAIGAQIEKVQQVMQRSGWPYEVIVVDDGSTDSTSEQVRRQRVRLIQLSHNRGYGAALKAGIAASQNDWIVITDADGTYPAEAIPALLERAHDYDMVVGARVGKNVTMPLERKMVKWFLVRLASYLAERPIPDLNSGLRVLKRPLVEKFLHLLPSGFSFTTTITLALLCNDYRVYYHPIDYYRRVGSSKIRPTDAYQFLLLILRTVVYFNPLRVFLPLGTGLFLAGLAKFIYDLFGWNISESAVLGMLGGVLLWGIGLLADQLSRIGLALKSK
jgi:glycosyltransferase involved in cell wall biosynthesis